MEGSLDWLTDPIKEWWETNPGINGFKWVMKEDFRTAIKYGKKIVGGIAWLDDITLRPVSDIVAGFGDTITFGGKNKKGQVLYR